MFSSVKLKTNPSFAKITFWKEQPFHFYCLFDESRFSNICTLWYVIMECIEPNWLCKHMIKVRNSQGDCSCTEFSKRHFFPVSIVYIYLLRECCKTSFICCFIWITPYRLCKTRHYYNYCNIPIDTVLRAWKICMHVISCL